ncbi:MAG: FliG C-terminal domain-containing protein, partial [Armatimonadota bacterium]
NVAMILGHLSPEYAAKLLSFYDEEKRNDIAFRLAKLQDVDPKLMEAVSMALRKRLEVHKVVKGSSKSIIANTSMNQIIEDAKSNLADSIDGSYTKNELNIEVGNKPEIELKQSFDLGEFVQEDSIESIATFNPMEMTTLINNVEMSDICLVLRLASDRVKNAFLDNVPQESKFLILSEIESPSHATISDIEDAQCRVMEVVKEILEERSSMNAA